MKTHSPKRWIRQLRLSCLTFCFCSIALYESPASQYAELEVNIELNDWSYWFLEDRGLEGGNENGNSTSIFREPVSVRCVVGTNSWLMEGQFLRNAVVTRWFTGSNIVERTRIIAPSAEIAERASEQSRLKVTSPRVGEQHTRIHDTPDGNPGRPVRIEDLFPDALGKVCWLAFCSGPALKLEGRRIPLPSPLWKQFFSGTEFSDKTVVFPDALGLPRRIEVVTDQGQHLLNYQVRSSTNVLGWEIPLEFYLLQYRPAPASSPNSWELHLTARGKVTAIRTGDEPLIPDAPAD